MLGIAVVLVLNISNMRYSLLRKPRGAKNQQNYQLVYLRQKKTCYRFEKGPLVDMSESNNFQEIEDRFELLQSAKVEGVFIPGSIVGDTYDLLEESTPNILDQFKTFAEKAKKAGLR